MKKIMIFFLILIIPIKYFSPTEEEVAYKMLEKHLKEKYEEEFEIKYFFKRAAGEYESTVYPKSYIGTIKEYDSYYHGIGASTIGSGAGDTYGKVIVQEGANEYYRPKLEELFGKNILSVFKVRTSYVSGAKSYLDEKRKNELEGRGLPLEGGIYIFGRVENELDREKYRESIYKFIQYLKETNSFDYSDIAIVIYDERSLANSYSQVLPLLKEAKKTEKNSYDYKKKRKEILESVAKDFNTLKEIEMQNKLENIEKSNMLGKNGWTNDYSYSQIYHKAIRSPKFIKNNSFLREYVPIEYNSISELKLLDSIKIDYKEYDKEALRKGKWGD